MAQFFKVNRDTAAATEFAVSVENVRYVFPQTDGTGSTITYADGSTVDVSQSVDDIVTLANA